MKSPVMAIVLASMAIGGGASAEAPVSLVGTWTLQTNIIERQGSTSANYGEQPSGQMILTNDGHFQSMSLRHDLPRFASGARLTGTPDENKAVVQGSIALYGTYVVDGSTVVFRIEKSTFPNWDGQEQRRPFTLNGDKLEFTLPASGATGTSRVVWVRASH
jgi:hypothetical protein